MNGSKRQIKRDIDFFAALKEQDRHGKGSKRGKSFYILIVAAAALLGAVCVWGYLLSGRLGELRSQIGLAEEYVSASANVSAYQSREELRSSQAQLRRYNERSERYTAALKKARRLGARDFEQVERQLPDSVRVERYAFHGDTMTLSCVSADKDAPALFAENLTACGSFGQVTYSGFQSRRDQSGLVFTFEIGCQLWDDEEGEGAQ